MEVVHIHKLYWPSHKWVIGIFFFLILSQNFKNLFNVCAHAHTCQRIICECPCSPSATWIFGTELRLGSRHLYPLSNLDGPYTNIYRISWRFCKWEVQMFNAEILNKMLCDSPLIFPLPPLWGSVLCRSGFLRGQGVRQRFTYLPTGRTAMSGSE